MRGGVCGIIRKGAWGQDYDKPSPQDLYLRFCSTFVFNHMILCFESICHGLLFQLTNLEKNSAVVIGILLAFISTHNFGSKKLTQLG